ncbi:winged helix-turn-helix domain-containing protein [Thermococcus aggregans]|uniref:Winged helix-turn-helix domain-containing protein n=1 Tax=Thermococcus aggregans TaxID=110163 RepID=A0A9E7SP65_THEAG|nr:winged helix-turn-helix domain-containing protein [Thermococcus aggregans]USS41124.1 winged helix-turn-helix domain-containing protein [Thermococcus aggregans]
MKEVLIITDPEKIKLLGDRTRLDIVNLLRERAMSVSEISVVLKKNPSTIYRHINLLEKAGFVEKVGRDGNETLYRRSARIFLITPYQDRDVTTPTMRALRQQEAETMYKLFKDAGFNIEDKKAFIETIEKFLTTVERLSRDLIKRLAGLNLNPIEFIHLMNLLVLINSPKLQEEAKKLRELLGLKD